MGKKGKLLLLLLRTYLHIRHRKMAWKKNIQRIKTRESKRKFKA